jgi:hypothetical protein
MIKQVQFKGRDEDGNVFCQPILGGYRDFVKTAAAEWQPSNLHPTVQRFIKEGSAKSDKGVYVLVNALGASEYWGSNVNGDSFPESALIHSPPGWSEMSPEQMRRAAKDWKYGYPTFMNAHPFKHHVNKDPSRAFGHVEIAVWNPKMHRVELVVFIDRKLCEKNGATDVLERIENGEFPDVSMGCKVPYDRCSICDKKSKTQEDYCKHAKTMMNKILPDGRKVCVHNDFPRFFDISFVFIGADKSAKMLAKLAHVNGMQCMGDFCAVPRLSADVAEKYSSAEVDGGYLDSQTVLEDFYQDARAISSGSVSVGKDGSFDENKVMIGYASEKDAKASYDHHMGDAKERFGGIEQVQVSALTTLFGDNGEVSEKEAQSSCSCSGSCSPCQTESFSKLAEAFGVKSASQSKLSEIIKTIPAGPFRKAYLPKLEKAEGRLPKTAMYRMAKFAMEESLSTAAFLGIVLRPEEFQHVVLTKIGEAKLADTLDSSGVVFSKSASIDSSLFVDKQFVNEDLSKYLAPYIPERSIAGPLIEKRASIRERLTSPRVASKETTGDLLLDKIAELYNGYRRDLVKKATIIDRYMVSDPHLSSALAGGSMVEAFAGGIVKTASASVLGPESLAYLVGAHYENRDFHLEALAQSGVVAAA